MNVYKDAALARLADSYNVASFVSFSPDLSEGVRYAALRGPSAELTGQSWREAAARLLGSSGEGRVNVRTFRPEQPSGNPFFYGIDSIDELDSLVRAQAANGYFTILNETIDVCDGGVSGVAHGEVVEFSFGSTPRAVESGDHVSLPIGLGLWILETVYGFEIALGQTSDRRVEFSIHPLRVGVSNSHILVWEVADLPSPQIEADVSWPNQFSRILGDKAFGLLVAHGLGLAVPRSTVIGRRVAPYSFGRTTGTSEHWIRTVPAERTPGRFTTVRGWIDPYELMRSEDPTGKLIAAIISQDGINAQYSGAAVSTASGDPVIEGVPGFGDEFMQGRNLPTPLPRTVFRDVFEVWVRLKKFMPAPSFEWVHDGHETWIVQLHADRAIASSRVIAEGDPSGGWLDFDPNLGLEVLRALIVRAQESNSGIRVRGAVGVTSHIGDVLRTSGVPAIVEP